MRLFNRIFNWFRDVDQDEGFSKLDKINALENKHFPYKNQMLGYFQPRDGVVLDHRAADALTGIKTAFSLHNAAMNDAALDWYYAQSFIGYQACALLSQQWLINKACAQVGLDATRNGWRIVDTELDKVLSKYDKAWNVPGKLAEFSHMLRIFGIRIAMFKFSGVDDDFYKNPFNIDSISKKVKYEGFVQIDPYWTAPSPNQDTFTDPTSPDFYEPEYWIINGKTVHKSHLIIERYVSVPDILKPVYQFGGISLAQLIYERVYCAERTANEIPQLVLTKRLNVRKVEDIRRIIMDPVGVRDAMESMTYFRDNFGQLLIGKDEDYQQHETSMADVDDVMMSQYQLVAAVANVPVTELLGTTPKGFQSTGEFERASYNKTVRATQKHEIEPLLLRHYQMLQRSLGLEGDIEIEWAPLYEPTEDEQLETNTKKVEQMRTLQEMGAIDVQAIVDKLNNDPKSGFSGLVPPEDETFEDVDDEEETDKGAATDVSDVDGEKIQRASEKNNEADESQS